MPPVIHPIWLLLLLCGLVLLIGCSALSSRTPVLSTPAYPPVTLTVYRFPGTPVSPLHNPPVLMTPVTVAPSASPPTPSIEVDAPTCYTRPGDGLICTGKIWNRSRQPLTRVRLQVALQTGQADSLHTHAQQMVSIEQQYIPAGTFAPYRALFDSIPSQQFRTRTTLFSADFTDPVTLPVGITEERIIRNDSSQYTVSATLTNTTSQRIEPLRAVVTLLAPDNRVTGYRVQRVPALPPDSLTELEITLTSEIDTAGMRYTLHLERS
jgi:hypothetical protein